MEDSELKFYTLPEFTPASKLRIRDANNFCEDIYREGSTEEDGSVLVTVLTRTMILRIKVEREAKRVKAFDYPHALVVCQRGPIACVANSERYDIMDLERGGRIPLFPINQNADMAEDGTQPLHPLILSVGEEDFLVTTGTTLDDPALGMFVDLNGDPVRGTLMFSTYPRTISIVLPLPLLILAINYPFVFAMMQNFDIEIHSVESQQIVQIINSPLVTGNANVRRVPEGSRICLEALAQKLLMVPLNPSQEFPRARRDEEIQIARRLATISSRIYVNSNTTISCIITTPWLLQADALLDSNRVEEALLLTDRASQTMDNMFDAERLFHEVAYINQKAGLVLFRETLFEEAINHLEKVNTDPRLIISLFPAFSDIDTSALSLYSGVRDTLLSLQNVENAGTSTPILISPLLSKALCDVSRHQACEKLRAVHFR